MTLDPVTTDRYISEKMPDLYAPSAQQHAVVTHEAYSKARDYHARRVEQARTGQPVVVESREQVVTPVAPLKRWQKVWLMQHLR